MGRARVDWRKEGVITSKTRHGKKEFSIYKSHPQPLPQKEVSLAVSYLLQNTEADYNFQEKSAVSSVAAQLIKTWEDFTDIETTRHLHYALKSYDITIIK